jgi:hypothetical protein
VQQKPQSLTRLLQTDPIRPARDPLHHPGWLRRKNRLASVGTGGWFQSESPAVFIGIRNDELERMIRLTQDLIETQADGSGQDGR